MVTDREKKLTEENEFLRGQGTLLTLEVQKLKEELASAKERANRMFHIGRNSK